jgi:hypothetical protein
MDNDIQKLNRRVPVVAVFRLGNDSKDICYPVRMRLGNREVNFTELGLRHPTVQGRRMIHVFDVTDGTADYRLEFNAETLGWTLMAVLEGHYETRA